MNKIPLNDIVINALARLVDDAQKERRDPSHSDIEFLITHAGLAHVDPHKAGMSVGKAKRIRKVLSWAFDNDLEKAEKLASGVLSLISSCGGFREASPYFVGIDAVKDLADALKPLGMILDANGSVLPVALESLSGKQLTAALRGYVDRAKKGIEDDALVVGTGKDLMEAVAAHVIQEFYGRYQTTDNFPTLLGQAFTVLGMATSEQQPNPIDHQRTLVERSMFETACAINKLRNKQGAGHGRPWLPDLKPSEVKAAIEFIGVLSELMLNNLEVKKP